jgi:hypothetical protein
MPQRQGEQRGAAWTLRSRKAAFSAIGPHPDLPWFTPVSSLAADRGPQTSRVCRYPPSAIGFFLSLITTSIASASIPSGRLGMRLNAMSSGWMSRSSPVSRS